MMVDPTTRASNAQVTREVRERSQHSLQTQFRHVVEPRKLNVAKKGSWLKGEFVLIYCVLGPFVEVLAYFARMEDIRLS